VAGSAARIKEAREAVGPDVQIMLDAHGSTGVTEAIKLAREVEQYDIAWYEEPVIYHNFPGMAEVRRATSIPIATGEDLYGRHAFRDLGLARAADIWQPDTAMAGGITELVRIAGLASAMEVQLAPHCWGSAFLWAASLQLAGALPSYYIFEFGQAYSPLRDELVSTPASIGQDGCVPIPTGPGLGVELDPDMEWRFPYDPSVAAHRPLVAQGG
jgi:L-alanine-DL-glutamate epimerase-like enolase superfamily enzyme